MIVNSGEPIPPSSESSSRRTIATPTNVASTHTRTSGGYAIPVKTFRMSPFVEPEASSGRYDPAVGPASEIAVRRGDRRA